MKLLFCLKLLILFHSLTAILCDKQIQCNSKSLNSADNSVAKILTLGQPNRKYPINDDQATVYCQDTFKLINSVENYAKSCLNGITKQVSQILFYQVKNQVKQLCAKNSKRRKELIKVAPCANRAAIQFNKCNTNFVDKLLGISNADETKRIPHICCEYQKIFTCIHERGSKFCNENELDTAANLIRVMTGGVLGSLCADYREDSDKCDKLGKLPKKKRSQRRSQSFYAPLIQVFNSFEDKNVRIK